MTRYKARFDATDNMGVRKLVNIQFNSDAESDDGVRAEAKKLIRQRYSKFRLKTIWRLTNES